MNWDYEVMVLDRLNTADVDDYRELRAYKAALLEKGDEGWELVTILVSESGDKEIFFFKREVEVKY